MRIVIMICLLSILFPVTGSADIFKYVDKDGIARYVDDMNKVPKEYQDQVVRHVVPETDESLQKDTVKTTNTQIPSDIKEILNKKKIEDAKKKAQQDAEAKKKALLKEKQELEAEYAALMKENTEISDSIREWSKRYKTRRRKGVARKKLKELEIMQMEWEEKYKAWETKNAALEEKMH